MERGNASLIGEIDRISFILGMMTAFGECVAGEVKRIAFSPPFYEADREKLIEEAERIAKEQNVFLFFEENLDLPIEKRVYWWVIYKFDDDLEAYQTLRTKGYNPIVAFSVFAPLLGYGLVWAEGSEKRIPKMRKETTGQMDPVNRILLQNNT